MLTTKLAGWQSNHCGECGRKRGRHSGGDRLGRIHRLRGSVCTGVAPRSPPNRLQHKQVLHQPLRLVDRGCWAGPIGTTCPTHTLAALTHMLTSFLLCLSLRGSPTCCSGRTLLPLLPLMWQLLMSYMTLQALLRLRVHLLKS